MKKLKLDLTTITKETFTRLKVFFRKKLHFFHEINLNEIKKLREASFSLDVETSLKVFDTFSISFKFDLFLSYVNVSKLLRKFYDGTFF